MFALCRSDPVISLFEPRVLSKDLACYSQSKKMRTPATCPFARRPKYVCFVLSGLSSHAAIEFGGAARTIPVLSLLT